LWFLQKQQRFNRPNGHGKITNFGKEIPENLFGGFFYPVNNPNNLSGYFFVPAADFFLALGFFP
tara:strand:- start:535 stop:726 length:192 start_codon:yes stop_codon:yes gene_type:complete